MKTKKQSSAQPQGHISGATALRLLGLLVALWGTAIAVVGVYGFADFSMVQAPIPASQMAQVTTTEDELRQPLAQESRPARNTDIATTKIDRSGSGWSISVDARAVDQVQSNSPRIKVGQLDLLQQKVPLRIEADNVSKIIPIIRNERTLTETRLSPAQQLPGGQWVYEWSVADVPAGQYRVQIEIHPENGSRYMAYDGNVYELPTYEDRETALAAGRESVEALYDSLDDIKTAIDNRPAPPSRATLLVSEANQARGIIQVYLETSTPAELQLQSPTGNWGTVKTFAVVGNEQQTTFDTTDYDDGWYALRAVAQGTQTVLSSVQPVRISNRALTFTATRSLESRSINERVREDSALNDARIDTSKVLQETDVAVTRDIGTDIYTEAINLVTNIWPTYRPDINQFSDSLATALRTGEEQSIKRAVSRFYDIETDVVSQLDGRRQAVINAVQRIVRNQLNERILRVEQAERYIALQVAQANSTSTLSVSDPVLSDSSVSFYALSTSTSITPAPEDTEPRTAGVTRADLLQVEGISTTSVSASGTTTGVLRGTALPDTSITLFIYSNPVVVTLNTNSDGTWEYQFDTELEDGQHEVYVALTDGVGQVVARSNPFRFAKTAQAFSPVDRMGTGQISQSNQSGVSLLNWPLVYLIVSLSVVVIGFLLMVVGATMRTRKNNNVVIKTKILP